MNITRKLSALAAVALAAMALTACGDDDATPISTPAPTLSESSYCSLAFEWPAVEGAVQYGCTLTADGADEPTAVTVTTNPRITFGSLEPATTYRLEVVAYSAMGSDDLCSEPVTLSARTSDLVVLAAPQLSLTDNNSYQTVTWPAVTAAKTYAYTLTNSEGTRLLSDEVSTNSLNLFALRPDTYQLTVQSCTTEGGYSNSPIAQLTVTTAHSELWRATGKYTIRRTGTSYTATLVAYSDCSYTIEGFCGVEGYDFTFFYDKDAPTAYALPADYARNDDGYACVATGLTDDPTIEFSTESTALRKTGSDTKGKFTFTTSFGLPDTFAWP